MSHERSSFAGLSNPFGPAPKPALFWGGVGCGFTVFVLFAFFALPVLLCRPPLFASGPTLARLSFWAPPERMAEFEAVYHQRVAPILNRYSLVESSGRGRATTDSVFCRLFEFKAVPELYRAQAALDEGPAWKAVLRDLGVAFATAGPDSLIRGRFGIYGAPSGPGKVLDSVIVRTVPAGQGEGQWQAYDATDGFPGEQGGCFPGPGGLSLVRHLQRPDPFSPACALAAAGVRRCRGRRPPLSGCLDTQIVVRRRTDGFRVPRDQSQNPFGGGDLPVSSEGI